MITTTVPAAAGSSRRARLALALAVPVALIASLLSVASPAAATEVPLTGATANSAAASCWEIKQNLPDSSDGVYWLLTPQLKAPTQFYCDMTTDGGGWVLIARGREGWKGQYNGLRSAVTMRTTVSGTAAFATAQLPGKTVDALLGGGRVDALADGVRVRRATNADGTAWQEVRFKYQSRDRWAWTFGAEHRVSSWRFDSVTGSGGQTASFGQNNIYNRVDTNAPQAQAYVGGIAYGAGVTGTNSPTTYLYSSTNGGGNARPFAQMFLRPKLRMSDFALAPIPTDGTTAITQRELPQSDAITTAWGVAGLANGSGGELNTEVAAFGQAGSTVFVGGNFQYAQRTQNATGSDRVSQPYVAGFNVDTGELVTTFRPVLNGQVKALAGLPDGRIAVGGQFSTVNGQPASGIAFLDRTTGDLSGWQPQVENRSSGGIAQVRGLSVQGNQLYIAGSFTHILVEGESTAGAWNGGRVNLATGQPDTDWNPRFNGTSVGVDASDQGDRTYFSGYFRQSDTVPAISAASVDTAYNGTLSAPGWTPQFSKPGVDYSGNIWQFGVAEAAGKVWLGGSEHSLFTYDRDDFTRTAGSITKNGGDFQAVSAAGNTIYGGCHCGDWVYSNAFEWSGIGNAWTQGDKMNLLGAWDAESGTYLHEFSPILSARQGYGVWALFTDSNGTLWAGGDISRSVRANEVAQWSGGYVRFRARDIEPPTTPGGFTSTTPTTTATLTWAASTDDRGPITYEVLREDRVIATTTATARTLTVPVGTEATRYFVRATDAAGNRSPSTPALTVAPPPVSTHEDLVLVANGAEWKWRFDTAVRPTDWNAATFDDSAWASGAAPLGFGATSIVTNIATGAPTPRPLSAQFRRTFTLDSLAGLSDVELSAIADDGAVVYLNGVELGRKSLPAGTLTQSTYATAAPRSTAAASARLVFDIPVSALVVGTNSIAVSTHVNYRSTPDVSFDLTLTAVRD